MNDNQHQTECASTSVAVAVQRYRGTATEPPPEVAALGSPEYVLSLSPIYTFPTENWAAFVAAGLAIFFGAAVLTVALGPHVNAATFLLAISGLLVAFVPALAYAKRPQSVPGYAVYAKVLVITEGQDFTVIPWDAIEEWSAFGGSFKTADGQSFVLSPHVSGWSAIIGKVYESLTARKMPAMLETLRRGESVTFGDITISAETLRYGSQTIRWEDVTSFVYVINRGLYRIHQHGALLPNLLFTGTIPNGWLLHAAIAAACPDRLKISHEDAAKWWRAW
jgi:hypothetical protein